MRRDKETRQMALRIGIALMAGMFSIVPVVHGAPVLNKVVSGGATVDQTTTANVTDITSQSANNVIDWHDFSVASGETVRFDGGAKTNNYMNIVSGANTSVINGAIQGGNEVYIINPNGVIFGKGSSVDVGSLYASTRGDAVATVTNNGTTTIDYAATRSNIITPGTSTTGAAMDIVNMGNISATNVVLEGENIRLLNDADIKATSVTLRADDGYIHLGSAAGDGSTKKSSTATNAPNKYSSEKLTSSGSAKNVEDYVLVYDDNTTVDPNDNNKTIAAANKWSATLGTGSAVTGNYMLAEDIDGSASGFKTVSSFVNGNIDGNLFAVKNATGDSGLFASTNNAIIMNMGVKDSAFDATNGDIGAFITTATDTTLKNVYNDNSTITGAGDYSAGLVAFADGITIDSSYSTGNIYSTGTTAAGNGLVGYVQGSNTVANKVTNSYSTGKAINGMLSNGDGTAKITFDKVYAYGTAFTDNYGEATIKNSIVYDANQYRTSDDSGQETNPAISGSVDLTAINTFKSSGTCNPAWDSADISDIGGLNYDSNGKLIRPTWRIYEGQSAPILTAFTKGIKTTTYNYAYYDNSGVKDTSALSYNNYNNGGADMTAYTYTADATSATGYKNDGLVYNGETLKIVDSSGTALTSVDTSALFQKADASTIDVAHISYDTSGQKDATYSATAGQGKKALIYSDQTGYDLVGNNVSIAPRRVTITNNLTNKKIVKEYDGSADARDHVSDLFSGNSTTSTGILAADSSSVMVKLSNTATAEFYDQSGTTASGDAGANKVVKIDGDVYISNGSKDANGNWAAYSGSNYVVMDANGNAVSSVTINGSVDAAIYQRRLVVDLNNVDLDKEYDKEQYVVDSSGNKKSFSTSDFTFDTAGKMVNTGDVSLSVGTGDAYYWDKTIGAKTADVGNHDVKIEGISLSGSGVKNYVLTDSNGKIIYSFADVVKSDGTIDTSVTAGVTGTFTKDGAISPRQISNTGFQWYYTPTGSSTATTPADANKEYDNTTAFNAPSDVQTDSSGNALWYVTNANATGIKGLLAGDSLEFRVDSAEFTTAADNTGTAISNAGTAQGAHYSVTITGASAKNYTFDGTNALTNGGAADVYGAGTIAPRTIYLVNGSNAVKDYDGNAYVSNNNTPFDLSSGYLAYDTTKGAAHKLLIDDTGVNDGATISITGEYQSTNGEGNANVNYDTATNSVLPKNIIYNATVMQNGSASSNYILMNGNTGIGNTNTYSGTGKIEQKQLGSLTFVAVSKTYDGSTAVTNTQNTTNGPLYTNDIITLNTPMGIISGESISDVFYVNNSGELDATGLTKLTGVYGDYVGGVFTANANATLNSQTGAHVTGFTTSDTRVQYTGVEALLKNHNYKLATTDGNVMYGNGTINRYLISDKSAITLDRNTTAITKEYDSTNAITSSPNSYLSSNNAKVTLSNGTTISGNDGLSVTVAGAEYSSVHSNDNTAQDVYYYVTANATGNYDVDGSLKETSGTHQGEIKLTLADGGLITQKHITANNTMLADPNLTKPYDSTDEVLKTGDNLIDISSQILSADAGTVTNGITANYVTDSTGAVGDVDASLTTQDKYVKYTLALNNDNNKDYFIDDGTGSITVSYTNGTTSAVKNTGATDFVVANNGTINKQELTVEFYDIYKTYDGNANVSHTPPGYHYTISGNTYDPVQVDTDAVTGIFGDAVLDANGNVTSFTPNANAGGKTVQYTNVTLTSTNPNEIARINRNYSVAGGSTVYNTDTTNNYIGKATIGLSDLKITANDVSKEYDGTTAVDNANSYINGSYIDLGNNNHVNFTYDTTNVTADFTSKGSGTANAGVGTGKDVTFTLNGITIPANVLANFDWDPNDAPTAANGSITIDRTRTGIGEVTPRNIYATINNPTVSKTYNASNNILDSTGADISNVGSSLVSFSRADGSAALVGGTTNASSAVYTDPNKGTDKNVEYTIEVSDGANYSIYYNQNDANGANYKTTDTSGNTVNAVGYTGTVNTVTTPGNIINVKDLTLSFRAVSKDYDGTTNVPSGMITPNFSGFASTTDENNIGLKNGYTAVFASPDVLGIKDANGNYTNTNYITYGNLELDGTGKDNYNLLFQNADGTAGTAAATIGAGTINKYRLTQAPDITRTTNAVTKEYAGSTNGKVAYLDNEDLTAVKNGYLQSAEVEINGVKQQLPFELTAATYANNDGSVTGNIARAVTFSVKLDSNNIDFSDPATGVNADGVINVYDTGTITPRKLYVTVDSAFNPSKVYDGTTTVLDNLPTAVLSITNTNKIVSGESVVIDNTAATLNAQYKGKNAGTDKVVYTVKLLPSSTSSNYELVDATGNPISSIEGDGKITSRPVTISLQNPITLADKAYNGSDVADATAIVGNYSLEVQNGGDTGILTAEVNEISLNEGAITATYANGGHVVRDKYTGEVLSDTVNFGNFSLTSTNANNPASNYTLTPATLQGSGKITPLAIEVDLDHSPEKVYDGTTDVGYTIAGADNKLLSVDTSNVIPADNGNISVSVTSGNFTPDGHVNTTAGTKEYEYVVALEDTQGNADYELQLKNGSVRSFVTNDYGQTATISGTDGNITPKNITFTAANGINKTYDGTQVYDNATAAAQVTFTGLASTDSKSTLNAVITAVTTDDADATNGEADNTPKTHTVQYTVTINNTDYQLGNNTELSTGTISRKGLNIVATPVSVNVGDSVPASFSGSVQGLVKNNNVDDTGLASSFTFGPDGTLSTTTAGKYGIYGWYMGKKSGNFGRNYTFDQVPGNATAFTVNFVNNTDNPDTKITPTPDIYHKISKDMNSGFGDNDIAAIEYRNKKGTVIGTVTIDSGEVHSGGVESGTSSTDLGTDNTNLGKIGIAGGDIVNMEGADAASNANIAVSGDGTTVNLEVYSVKDEENEDKVEKEEKEGEIAIKSESSEGEDEIELTVEGEGVNVA